MKYLILLAILATPAAFAFDSDSNDELVCAKETEGYGNTRNIAMSCVSKASIELDKAQLKLVKMQIRKLEVEIKMMEEMGQLPTPTPAPKKSK